MSHGVTKNNDKEERKNVSGVRWWAKTGAYIIVPAIILTVIVWGISEGKVPFLDSSEDTVAATQVVSAAAAPTRPQVCGVDNPMPQWEPITIHACVPSWGNRARPIELPPHRQTGCIVTIFTDETRQSDFEAEYQDLNGDWQPGSYTGNLKAARYCSTTGTDAKMPVKIGEMPAKE
jgi:hypothetical protein